MYPGGTCCRERRKRSNREAGQRTQTGTPYLPVGGPVCSRIVRGPRGKAGRGLEAFLYRLAKDCGIEFGERRQLSEEEQMERRKYHAQIVMEADLAAIQAGKAHL